MKLIDENLLNETTERAKQSPRLRMNHNFHESLDDPVNRLINAMEPGTYLRPHRHKNPDKNEIFLLLRGKAALFLFDDDGNITEKMIIEPAKGTYGGEIPPDVWHTFIIPETGSVVYEIKQGPFVPLSPENMAPWSPAAEDIEEVKRYMEMLKSYLPAEKNT
jgi:cupin fold WbuC family metalloprotein